MGLLVIFTKSIQCLINFNFYYQSAQHPPIIARFFFIRIQVIKKLVETREKSQLKFQVSQILKEILSKCYRKLIVFIVYSMKSIIICIVKSLHFNRIYTSMYFGF